MTSTHQNRRLFPDSRSTLTQFSARSRSSSPACGSAAQCQAIGPEPHQRPRQTWSPRLTRLAGELDRARLDRANLRAAMRAALAAHADGEADPLWYLRDELNAAESAADASRGPR